MFGLTPSGRAMGAQVAVIDGLLCVVDTANQAIRRYTLDGTVKDFELWNPGSLGQLAGYAANADSDSLHPLLQQRPGVRDIGLDAAG